jgi:hypothetical protein
MYTGIVAKLYEVKDKYRNVQTQALENETQA